MTVKVEHCDALKVASSPSSTRSLDVSSTVSYDAFVASGSKQDLKDPEKGSCASLDSTSTDSSVDVKKQPFEDDEEEEKTFCCGLCCFQGCIWGLVGAFYFFILIPTAIMLIMHGYNTDYGLTLGLGGLLLIISTCGIPAALLGIRHVKRKRRKRREAYLAERSARLTKASYENQMFDVVATDAET